MVAPGPDMRRKMLAFIKASDGVFVRDVAGHFRTTHEGARKQLVRLEEEGLLQRKPSLDPLAGPGEPGVGRPKDHYTATAAADALLPKAYDKLSAAIVAHMQEGPTSLRDTLAALARAQVEAWRPRLEGKPLAEKLLALRALYAENDPFASVETRDGETFLVERNCPFLNVALEHPALCSLTVNTLESLLGHAVTRQERFQKGDGRCVFRIGPPLASADETFLLESERAPAA